MVIKQLKWRCSRITVRRPVALYLVEVTCKLKFRRGPRWQLAVTRPVRQESISAGTPRHLQPTAGELISGIRD